MLQLDDIFVQKQNSLIYNYSFLLLSPTVLKLSRQIYPHSVDRYGSCGLALLVHFWSKKI